MPESPDALSLSRLPPRQPANDKWLFALRQSASFPSTFYFRWNLVGQKILIFPPLVFWMMEFALIRHTDRWSLLTAEIIDDLVFGLAEGRGNNLAEEKSNHFPLVNPPPSSAIISDLIIFH